MVRVSYKFLDDDIAAQEEAATNAVNLAKQLEVKINATVNGGQITFTPAELEVFRDGYLKISSTLASNVATTALQGAAFADYVTKKST